MKDNKVGESCSSQNRTEYHYQAATQNVDMIEIGGGDNKFYSGLALYTRLGR